MKKDDYQQFVSMLGRNVKSARLSSKLLQEDVANSLGMTRVAIGYIEQGRRAPKLRTLFDLANLYGVDIQVFFDSQPREHEDESR